MSNKIKYFFILVFSINNMAYSGWIQQISGTNAELLNVFFINENNGFITGKDGKLLKTTNGGNNWQLSIVNPFFNISQIYFVNDITGYITCEYEFQPLYLYYIYKTTNTGFSWQSDFSAYGHKTAGISFINQNTGYFAATRCDSAKGTNFYRKINQGQWQLISSHDSCGLNTMKFKNNTGYWTGSTGGLIFKTTDSGNNWYYSANGFGEELFDLHMFNKDTVIVSGAYGKLFMTTNGGDNWNAANSGTSLDLVKISFPDNTTGYIAANGQSYIKTTDSGQNWTTNSTGHIYSGRSVFFINSLTGYIVGTAGSILKTTDGGAPIGITPISSEIPERYALFQNYPNPFNPVTSFRFLVSAAGPIKIIIYNNIGVESSILFNGMLKPGIYKATWNASGLPSGVYYCRLIANGYTDSKKMVLLK